MSFVIKPPVRLVNNQSYEARILDHLVTDSGILPLFDFSDPEQPRLGLFII